MDSSTLKHTVFKSWLIDTDTNILHVRLFVRLFCSGIQNLFRGLILGDFCFTANSPKYESPILVFNSRQQNNIATVLPDTLCTRGVHLRYTIYCQKKLYLMP